MHLLHLEKLFCNNHFNLCPFLLRSLQPFCTIKCCRRKSRITFSKL